MRVLVDTHMGLWALAGDSRLSDRARALLTGSESAVLPWSIASSYELAVKVAIGKLALDGPLEQLLEDLVSDLGLAPLPSTVPHCAALAKLPLHHRDPFDRMLVAPTQAEGTHLLSTDPLMRAYDIKVLW